MQNSNITKIYHLTYDLSEELTDFVQRGDEVQRQYQFAVEAAMKGNVGSGSNTYTHLTEWADFHVHEHAIRATLAMDEVVARFDEMRSRHAAAQPWLE